MLATEYRREASDRPTMSLVETKAMGAERKEFAYHPAHSGNSFPTYRQVAPATEFEVKVLNSIFFKEHVNSQASKNSMAIELPFESERRRALRSQLARLRDTPKDWDGFGSLAPDHAVLQSASYIIDKWDWSLPLLAEIGPLSDGAVCFEFYSADDTLIGALDLISGNKATYAVIVGENVDTIGEFDVYCDQSRDDFFELLKKKKVRSER